MAALLSPTPIQALRTCLSVHTADAALDGIPVRALFEHFLQAQASGLAGSCHELRLLEALLANWLKGLESAVGNFSGATLPVLQQQKKALQRTQSALTALQQCLQALRPQRPRQGELSRLRTVAVSRPKSWRRTQIMMNARAHRV